MIIGLVSCRDLAVLISLVTPRHFIEQPFDHFLVFAEAPLWFDIRTVAMLWKSHQVTSYSNILCESLKTMTCSQLPPLTSLCPRPVPFAITDGNGKFGCLLFDFDFKAVYNKPK